MAQNDGMTEQVASVLIAEDQDITRLGLRLTLEKIDGVQVVGEAVDGEAVVNQAKELRPQIILMDIDLPGVDGIAATKEIKQILPKTGIIMFTSDSSDESIFAALSAGADGYCLKNISADRLSTAINSVMQGAAWLDPGIANRVLRAHNQAKETTASPDITETHARIAGRHILEESQVALLHCIEAGQSLEQIADQFHQEPQEIEKSVREVFGTFLQAYTSKSKGGASQSGMPTGIVQGRSLPPITPGTVLGDRYVIEAAIGTGGMSTVYRAKHQLMERLVAIKMLHQKHLTKDLQVKRFYQEAKAVSVLSHPNIITTFDFGVTPEGQPFLVMDYIDGSSLQDYIHECSKIAGAHNLARSMKIFIQVCDALAHAHKKGMIHRDLKPSNIMLVKPDDETEDDFVKLVDFGIAKFLIDSELDLRLTKTGDLFGTPFYMSPEQCRGQAMDA
ncbi:MAG TPA: protein kinase, partial [Chroococcales cyanobacterium]